MAEVVPTIDNVNPTRKRVIQEMTDAILEEYPFDENKTVLMDCGCGTGLMSQQLAPHCKEILGCDNDAKAVELYNTAALNQGLAPEEMRAICVDPSAGGGVLQGKKFDVILASQIFHHVPVIADVTKELATHLTPSSGVLLIIDHVKPSTSSEAVPDVNETLHDHQGQSVAHPGGFTEADICAALEAAGLKDISFKAFTEFKKKGQTLEMFIAKGTAS